MNTKQWIAVGAASALGISIIGASAIATATGLDLRDVVGVPVAPGTIVGGPGLDNSSVFSTVSAVSAASAVSATSAPSPSSSASAPSANSPASPASAPSAPSAPSANSPAIADSAD